MSAEAEGGTRWVEMNDIQTPFSDQSTTTIEPTLQPGEPVRRHRGDFLSPQTRSRVMARIKGKDTAPERQVAAILASLGVSPEQHVKELPGRPDFVLTEIRVAIFVDGDFWHGWRFPIWRLKLSEKWEKKIQATRNRDRRNHAKLRRAGWTVVRIWEHQLIRSPEAVRKRLANVVLARRDRDMP
jgi:DNA mismatch endonuclease (patch repair protein)